MVSALATSEAGSAETATSHSPLFWLPLELREMIYLQLFQRGRIHLWYFGSQHSKIYKEGWWHAICHRVTDYGNDRCRTHPTASEMNTLSQEQIEASRLQVFGWLLCCRQA